MKRINNIFYSLQGEGRNTGRAAVFIRFAGCNLRCSFCDTEFESYREMSNEEIMAEVEALSPQPSAIKPLIVLTGGEPTLQVDEAFVDFLHQHGYEVAMESNGTRPAPQNLDWLTVSPKVNEKLEMRNEKWEMKNEKCHQPDEIKIVFGENTDPAAIISHSSFLIPHLLYLQPCDTGDPERNKAITQACVEYIKQHPKWRLSLQTHKLIDIE
ncbi:MAG: 7-carboxy-7-deazaguanine synthase QueE [Prevotella sp.]|nr:7-carboxy-7-deazaguanine synthase QueE [Prevotella sp.]